MHLNNLFKFKHHATLMNKIVKCK